MTFQAPPPPAAPALPRQVGRYRLRDRLDARGPVERWAAAGDAGGARVVLTEPPPAPDAARWPGLAWEAGVRHRAGALGLPRPADRFEDGGRAFLVLDCPAGVPLWDVWDDPAF